MRRLWTRKWLRAFVGLLAVVCLAVLALCARYRIWSYSDYRAYEEVRLYPVGKEFWFGRVTAGQGLEAFTADHPPHRARQVGRYSVLSYYTDWPTPPGSLQMESLEVIARDGRLVHAVAAGCTWHRVFFAMSPEDLAELDEAYRQLAAQKAKR